MGKSPIDSVGLTITAIGSVFLYAGIKGYSMLAVLQNLVTGKPILTDVVQTTPLTAPDSSAPKGTAGDAGNLNPNVASGTATPSGAYGTNEEIAKPLAAQWGWGEGTPDWDALVKLWQRESSWNNRAKNPSSGAYGIPQALPYTKMPKAAQPESAGGKSSAFDQILWGLAYIKGRYGTPSAAWAHEQSNGWY